MNEQDKKKVENLSKHFDDQAEPITGGLLGKMLEKNLPVYDVHYVTSRAIKILEEVLKSIDCYDEEIEKLRQERLKQSISESIARLKDIKTEDDDQPETQERNDRCESIAREWVFNLLNDKLILSDKDFVNTAIKEDDQHLLYKIAKAYLERVHSQMITSLGISHDKALKKLWGVESEKVTFKMINDLIKKDLS